MVCKLVVGTCVAILTANTLSMLPASTVGSLVVDTHVTRVISMLLFRSETGVISLMEIVMCLMSLLSWRGWQYVERRSPWRGPAERLCRYGAGGSTCTSSPSTGQPGPAAKGSGGGGDPPGTGKGSGGSGPSPPSSQAPSPKEPASKFARDAKAARSRPSLANTHGPGPNRREGPVCELVRAAGDAWSAGSCISTSGLSVSGPRGKDDDDRSLESFLGGTNPKPPPSKMAAQKEQKSFLSFLGGTNPKPPPSKMAAQKEQKSFLVAFVGFFTSFLGGTNPKPSPSKMVAQKEQKQRIRVTFLFVVAVAFVFVVAFASDRQWAEEERMKMKESSLLTYPDSSVPVKRRNSINGSRPNMSGETTLSTTTQEEKQYGRSSSRVQF